MLSSFFECLLNNLWPLVIVVIVAILAVVLAVLVEREGRVDRGEVYVRGWVLPEDAPAVIDAIRRAGARR